MKYKEEAVNAIIRPPRKHYKPADLPLFLDARDKHVYVRHPVNFSNDRNQKIVGSVYLEEGRDIMGGGPCAIYMHGNASSQLEGQFMVPNFCPFGVAVYLFDFAGCGESGGDYISLGYYEQQDVDLLIHYLAVTFGFGPFILWGRSMGAAVSMLAQHPKIVCRIADSCYSSITDLCHAIATSIKIPGFLQNGVIWWIKKSVEEKAGFDMSNVSPLDSATYNEDCPAIIGHADDDEFVPFEQGQQVFEAYSCPDKEFVQLHGGHNGRRNLAWVQKVCEKCFKCFGIDVPDFRAVHFYGLHSTSHFKNYEELLKTALIDPEKNRIRPNRDESDEASSGEP